MTPYETVRAAIARVSARELARRIARSDRTVRRWASGERCPSPADLRRLVDASVVPPVPRRKPSRRPGRVDAADFIRLVVAEIPVRELARRIGRSDMTVRRWARGNAAPTVADVQAIVDIVAPLGGGAGPMYPPTMAIDGNTRVGGVGQYTLRSARGIDFCFEKGNDNE